MPGNGWKTGSYECRCKNGYFSKNKSTHFNGSLVEGNVVKWDSMKEANRFFFVEKRLYHQMKSILKILQSRFSNDFLQHKAKKLSSSFAQFQKASQQILYSFFPSYLKAFCCFRKRIIVKLFLTEWKLKWWKEN